MRFLFLSASNFRPKLGLFTGEDLQYSAVEKRVQIQYTVQSEWAKIKYSKINNKSVDDVIMTSSQCNHLRIRVVACCNFYED